MIRLWRPVPTEHTFPSVVEWGRGFDRLREEFAGATGPFPPLLVDRAEGLFRDLLASMETPVLLHGDLHHFNILSHGDDWVAIDPQGVVGESAYEVGALLRNPMPEMMKWSDLKQRLHRRIDPLSDRLQIDRKRVLGWGLAQAVLSGWWSYEDHGSGWEGALHVAEVLSTVRV
jgi:streptomycin 6-kinase